VICDRVPGIGRGARGGVLGGLRKLFGRGPLLCRHVAASPLLRSSLHCCFAVVLCTVANDDDRARGDDAAALKGGPRNTTATAAAAANGRSGSRGLASSTSTAVGDETDQDRLLRHLNAREKVPRHTSVHDRGVHYTGASLSLLARVSCCSCYSLRAQVIFLEGLLARLYATAGGLQVGTIYAVAVMPPGP